MKRLLLILIVLPLLWIAGRALVRGLASDETLIRWQVEDMRDGYNSGAMGDVVRPVHQEWRHERSQVDRDLLKAGLVREFFQDRHPQTKALLRRVDYDEDSLVLQVSGDEAQLELELWFSRLKGEEDWEETWRARVEADYVRTEDGWRVRRSRHENLAGTQLSR